jgi:hypothetical protein
MILPILQKFREQYGAYFCSTQADDCEELQPYIDFIAVQSKLKPLLNITIERQRPIKFIGCFTSIYEPRSFSQVLNATGSALEEYLGKLETGALKSIDPQSMIPEFPGQSKKLTARNLDSLQLELGYYYSAVELKRGGELAVSVDAESDSWAPLTTGRIEKDLQMPIAEFAGRQLWTLDVSTAVEGLIY